MESISQPFVGTHLLKPRVFQDLRGDFVKTFHEESFKQLGIDFSPKEEFFSTSKRGVLRGMHFQLPPYDHDKLVYCVRGRVLDVLLDMRNDSPTRGKVASAELSEQNRLQFMIPRGVAHGFLALENDSVMIYKTSTVHMPSHDAGVRWDSFGFNWPESSPIISGKDRGLSPVFEFDTPF